MRLSSQGLEFLKRDGLRNWISGAQFLINDFLLRVRECTALFGKQRLGGVPTLVFQPRQNHPKYFLKPDENFASLLQFGGRVRRGWEGKLELS